MNFKKFVEKVAMALPALFNEESKETKIEKYCNKEWGVYGFSTASVIGTRNFCPTESPAERKEDECTFIIPPHSTAKFETSTNYKFTPIFIKFFEGIAPVTTGLSIVDFRIGGVSIMKSGPPVPLAAALSGVRLGPEQEAWPQCNISLYVKNGNVDPVDVCLMMEGYFS